MSNAEENHDSHHMCGISTPSDPIPSRLCTVIIFIQSAPETQPRIQLKSIHRVLAGIQRTLFALFAGLLPKAAGGVFAAPKLSAAFWVQCIPNTCIRAAFGIAGGFTSNANR